MKSKLILFNPGLPFNSARFISAHDNMKQELQASCKLNQRLMINQAKHQPPSLTILVMLVLQLQHFSCRRCLLCKVEKIYKLNRS